MKLHLQLTINWQLHFKKLFSKMLDDFWNYIKNLMLQIFPAI